MTLKGLAEILGVHTSTVGRVMDPETRHMVGEEVAQRVLKEAARHGYRPNKMAAALRTRRSNIVGVMLPDITNPVFPPIVLGIEDELRKHGYVALVTNAGEDPEQQRFVVDQLLARQVDALILATATRDDPVIGHCLEAGVALVTVNRSEDRGRVSSVVNDEYAGMRLAEVLQGSARLVLDADALNALAQDAHLQSLLQQRSANQPTVITPHPLEAARLLKTTSSDIQNNRLKAAQDLADWLHCTVVLKGSGTVIAAPGQTPRINTTGNGKLATGGTGDVLAGLMGARLAQGMSAFEAACSAVHQHGALADEWPEHTALTASRLASRRLALGFAVLLAGMIFNTGFGIYRLQGSADATRAMMEVPLAKERLISEWYRIVFAGIRRTTAIAKSSDTSLAPFFAEDIANSTKRAQELIKQIEALSTEEDKRLMAELGGVRKAYVDSRDGINKAKAAGNMDEAAVLMEKDYQPAAKGYEAMLQKLLDHQNKKIDEAAREIDAIAAQSRNLQVVLAVLTAAFSVAFAWWLATGITRPMRHAVEMARRVADGDLTGEHGNGQGSGQGGRAAGPYARDETGQLLQALEDMHVSLVRIVSQVRSGTDAITSASSQIASGNLDLSARTEQQASSLEETA
eukprot:gene19776-22482_t